VLTYDSSYLVGVMYITGYECVAMLVTRY